MRNRQVNLTPTKPIPADIVRGYYHELTRCDWCGVLDDRTERVSVLDELFWLHPDCRGFLPKWSEPVKTTAKILGFFVEDPQAYVYLCWRLSGRGVRYLGPVATMPQAEFKVASEIIPMPRPPLGAIAIKATDVVRARGPREENKARTSASRQYWKEQKT
jgi:hypothetical protein